MSRTPWLPVEEIGRRVREIRTEWLNINQTQLAERIGRPGSQSEISQIERGKKEPEANILADIAAIAGTTVLYFQEGITNEERAEKLVAAKWLERIAHRLRSEAVGEMTDDEIIDAIRERALQASEIAPPVKPRLKKSNGA